MQYSCLGKTDLEVSRICLGSMTWGEQNTEAEAHEQLDYALSQGVNFIDTAEMYAIPPRPETQGLTETYIGSWLKKTAKRDQVILATKVTGPAERVKHVRLDGKPDLDAAQVRLAIEGSLKRLQTDYVDLYQLHWPSRSTNCFGILGYSVNEHMGVAIAETLEALDKLVKEGKVRHIGISNETPWGMMQYLQLAEKHGWPRVVSIQNPYSLLNRSFEIGLAEMAWHEKVGLLAYSPLGFGMLSGKYLEKNPPANARLSLFPAFDRYSSVEAREAAAAYVALAREHQLDPAQMALAYVNSRPFLTANIIGATTMQQLRDNIASIDLSLSEEVLQGIEAIHARNSNPCP